MIRMRETIEIDDRKVIIKRYRIRPTGKNASSLETCIPKEAFERELRKLGLTYEQGIEQLEAVWRFDSFRGLHFSFEPGSIDRDRER